MEKRKISDLNVVERIFNDILIHGIDSVKSNKKFYEDMLNKTELIRQLFIGKVSDEIGFDKTLKLLQESKEVIEKAKN